MLVDKNTMYQQLIYVYIQTCILQVTVLFLSTAPRQLGFIRRMFNQFTDNLASNFLEVYGFYIDTSIYFIRHSLFCLHFLEGAKCTPAATCLLKIYLVKRQKFMESHFTSRIQTNVFKCRLIRDNYRKEKKTIQLTSYLFVLEHSLTIFNFRFMEYNFILIPTIYITHPPTNIDHFFLFFIILIEHIFLFK